MEKLEVAAAIVKETFTHPLTTSVIRVHGGMVEVDRVVSDPQQSAAAPPRG